MRIETCSAHSEMNGRRVTFHVSGLACVAEHDADGWMVTVGNVTYARAESLAAAIEEASGGLVRGENASKVASVVQDSVRRIEASRR